MAVVLTADANPGVASWSSSLSEVAQVAVVADPGNGQPIPVTSSASISLTIAAGPPAEANTVAAPTLVGQELLLAVGSQGAGGTRVVTFSASPFNQVPNSVVTFSTAGQCAMFKAFRIGANLVWKLVFVQGAVLS